MKDGWENFKIVATGRWSVSFIGFLIILPFGFLVSVERELSFNPEGDFYQAFLIASAGYLVTFLYVFIIQATLLKRRVLKAVPIMRCILFWYSAGLVLGASTSAYAKFAFGRDLEILERTVMPIVYTGTSLALTAYFLGTLGRLKEENRAFRNLESILLSDTKELTLSEGESYRNATTVYTALVRPEVKKISEVLSELEGKETDARLRGLIEKLQDQSKELLHLLDERISAQLAKQSAPLDSWNIRNKEVSLMSELFPRIISVRISFLVIALGTVTGQFPRNGFQGVVAGLIGALLISVGLFILSKFYKKQLVQGRAWLRIFFFLLAFLMQTLWTFLQPHVGFKLNDPYNPLYSGAKTIYGVYIASIIASLIVMNAEQKQFNFERNRDLLLEFDRRSDQMAVNNAGILQIRFGTLLGKLGSVTLAINLLEKSGGDGQGSLDIETILIDAAEILNDSIVILMSPDDASSK